MRSILLYFLLICYFPLAAQELYERPLYDHIWLFNNSRLDFNYDPVLVEADDQPMPFEGTNASVCDEQGTLLAYTNGIYVSNAQGDTVRNGWQITDSLYVANWWNRGVVWPQHAIAFYSASKQQVLFLHGSSVTFPEPDQYNNRIFCFGLQQTLYDISMDSIILKNDPVIQDTIDLGKITATRSGDGESWWIGVSQYFSDKYYMLAVNDLEIQEIKETEAGEVVPTGLGQAKFSPDGKKYVDLDLKNVDNQTISIYDFDRCTGDLSNPIHIAYLDTAFVGGLAFSENSRFLYISSFRFVYQYDLESTDIAASRIVVATPQLPSSKVYFMAQLAPDGKIYLCTQGTADALHVIHHPNRKGQACGFEHLGQPLPANTFRTMPNYPYYGLGPWDGSPCDTLGIDNPTPTAAFEYTQDTTGLQLTFFDASHYAYSWSWDFGDGSPPTPATILRHPVHTYAQAGAYEVCLTASNLTGDDTYCETIQLGPVATQEVFVTGLSVTAWPNPVADDVLHIRIEGLTGSPSTVLRLTDSQGRTVRQESCPSVFPYHEAVISTAGLASGLYFYEVYDRRLLASGKVVVQ